MSQVLVKFDSLDDAARVDLTRIGTIAGANQDGTAVVVEPELEAWDDLDPAAARTILRASLAAAGIFAEVLNRAGGAAQDSTPDTDPTMRTV